MRVTLSDDFTDYTLQGYGRDPYRRPPTRVSNCGSCAVAGGPYPQPPVKRSLRGFGADPTCPDGKEFIVGAGCVCLPGTIPDPSGSDQCVIPVLACSSGSSWSSVDGKCHPILPSSGTGGLLALVALAVVGVIVFSKS